MIATKAHFIISNIDSNVPASITDVAFQTLQSN